ncbi:unnamed protein product [Oikopleura dioica]|uniref:Serine/threonine-protein kinase PLK n=1 Tax=Oikopleura dioica TaxID=34765 RepID=E4XEY9_OIKDI|nr:unnamed protein product [Oikopleura dioica]
MNRAMRATSVPDRKKSGNKIDEHVLKSGIDELAEFVDATTGTIYKKIRALGKGGFAKVYQCKRGAPFPEDYPDVALKIIPKSRVAKPSQLEKIHAEISIQSKLDHPNIVRLLTSFDDPTKICIAVELCHRKSLTSLVKQKSKVSQLEVARIGTAIVHALRYIHSRGIVHRDLKLGNILLTSEGTPKLADFGLAMYYEHAKPGNICGTPNFISPEVLNEHPHRPASDIWALGCVLCTLLAGKSCFDYTTMKETYQRILKLDYNLPEWLSEEAKDLIRRILVPDPTTRLNHEQILAHPMMQNAPTGVLSERRDSEKNVLTHNALKRRYSENTNQNLAPVKVEPVPQEPRRATSKTSAFVGYNTNQYTYNPPPPLTIKTEPVLVNIGNRATQARPEPLCKTLKSPKHNPTTRLLEDNRVVWISKWVDYTNKLGFGYKLSDGKIGANMPSPSKSFIILRRNGFMADDYSEYRQLRTTFMFNGQIEPEHTRHKKILDYFIKYMNENLTCGAENLMLLSREASNDTTDVRLTRQQNCEVDGKQAMAMELSNETLQVNFSGSRKFVIHKPRSLTRAIILVIDSQRQGQAFDCNNLLNFPQEENENLEHVHRIFHQMHGEHVHCWTATGWGSVLCKLTNAVGHV